MRIDFGGNVPLTWTETPNTVPVDLPMLVDNHDAFKVQVRLTDPGAGTGTVNNIVADFTASD